MSTKARPNWNKTIRFLKVKKLHLTKAGRLNYSNRLQEHMNFLSSEYGVRKTELLRPIF